MKLSVGKFYSDKGSFITDTKLKWTFQECRIYVNTITVFSYNF